VVCEVVSGRRRVTRLGGCIGCNGSKAPAAGSPDGDREPPHRHRLGRTMAAARRATRTATDRSRPVRHLPTHAVATARKRRDWHLPSRVPAPRLGAGPPRSAGHRIPWQQLLHAQLLLQRPARPNRDRLWHDEGSGGNLGEPPVHQSGGRHDRREWLRISRRDRRLCGQRCRADGSVRWW